MTTKTIFFILVFNLIHLLDRSKYTTNCIIKKKTKKKKKVIGDKSKQDRLGPILFAEEKRTVQTEIIFSPRVSPKISPAIIK